MKCEGPVPKSLFLKLLVAYFKRTCRQLCASTLLGCPMTEALAKACFKQCNKLTAVTMSAAKQRVSVSHKSFKHCCCTKCHCPQQWMKCFEIPYGHSWGKQVSAHVVATTTDNPYHLKQALAPTHSVEIATGGSRKERKREIITTRCVQTKMLRCVIK